MRKVVFVVQVFLIVYTLGVLPQISAQSASSIGVKATQDTSSQMRSNEPSVREKNEEENVLLAWFKAFVPLLQSLAWPGFLLAIILTFKEQLRQALKLMTERIQSGKLKIGTTELELTSVKNTEEFKKLSQQKKGEKPVIVGNPDLFQLLAKASLSNFMKSTKVMNTPTGCVVQVSTKEISPSGELSVAEAVTFVPGINVQIKKDQNGNIVDSKFISSSEQLLKN